MSTDAVRWNRDRGPCLYVLLDPRDLAVRYVGKTVGYPNSRWRTHLREATAGRSHNHRLAVLFGEVDDVDRVALDPELGRKIVRAAERLEAWHLQRDQLIFEAWNQGAGYREIARAAGLTHPAVMNIVTKMALEQKQITMRAHQELHPLTDPGGGD